MPAYRRLFAARINPVFPLIGQMAEQIQFIKAARQQER
jgi:hypothetical protein